VDKPPYDIFVSFNFKDKVMIDPIIRDLREVGLKVFEPSVIKPGDDWTDRIVTAIHMSRAVLVVIGPNGLGPWQQQEVDLALAKTTKVITLLLQGASRPEHDLLNLRQWIEITENDPPVRIIWRVLEGIMGAKPVLSLPQIGSPSLLPLQRKKLQIKHVPVYHLPNPGSASKLDLTWNTFAQGIENLSGQIREYGLHVDVCLGINYAGLVIAAILKHAAYDPDGDPVDLGYVGCGTKGKERVIYRNSHFPKVRIDEPNILLVDSEVKTGSALVKVVEEVKRRYPKATLYYAVLAALLREGCRRLTGLDSLEVGALLSSLCGEDKVEEVFLAFTMEGHGVEPPVHMR
jgi:hypothetical protein